jgi:hypothetical protein
MDRRRISLAELKNRFNYWIDGSGKRRYGYKVDRHYKKQNRDGRHFAENNYKNKVVMDQ